ncbi:hypothetical protein CFY87_09800 [Actinobacillus seminis]|uniref:Uncharacterized protein n=1 Tax=Actinobacillus seminis TaxID=722 RepID=A0ABX4FKP9_9PAST|nr:hypothetical protein [Actinobacillus seminis]OZN24342.1 hypothetical protein CFY87_09800 [Actinobacillus seminis]
MAFILFAALATGTAFANPNVVSELDNLRDDLKYLLIEQNLNNIYQARTDIAKNKKVSNRILPILQ